MAFTNAVSNVRLDLIDILAVPIASGVWVVLVWGLARSMGGRALTPIQRKMLGYGFVWVLGGGYVMLLATAILQLTFPESIGLFFLCAVPVVLIAWRRHRRARAASPNFSDPAQKKVELRQGLALVALLVSLIASSIEWEYVLDREGHWLGAMLWSMGVVGAILLAYGNRRATVIMGLRAYLGLLVIGAIAERKMAGLILAGVGGAVYVSLERIWKKSQPPVLELEALSRDPEARGNGSHVETKRH
jgi:hypothetical protein